MESNGAGFEELLTSQRPAVYREAVRLTRNSQDAEDLTQEVFLRAWRSCETFRPGSNMRAWLRRILMNAWVDGYRKSKRQPEWVEFASDIEGSDSDGSEAIFKRISGDRGLFHVADPSELIERRLYNHEIQRVLEAIPEHFRGVVLLRAEGYEYSEIAKILGVPIGTVMSRLHRGRHVAQAVRQLAPALIP